MGIANNLWTFRLFVGSLQIYFDDGDRVLIFKYFVNISRVKIYVNLNKLFDMFTKRIIIEK